MSAPRVLALALCLSFAVCAAAGAGESELEPTATGAARPTWAHESPLGPLEYSAGRGLSIGDTGIHVGGFMTGELVYEEGEPGVLEVDGVNLLVQIEPSHFLHAFAEIEVKDLLLVDDDGWDAESDPGLEVDRLYVELSVSDQVNLRLGKFLTPIGRWNPVPAEPFVWTTSEPLIAEITFDETVTGAMLRGISFCADGALTYSLYGQFVDSYRPDDEPEPADRSAGMRLEYTTTLGDSSAGFSFLASELDGQWHYLGGLDTQLRRGALELTGEFLFEDGDLEEREIWGGYLQSAYELLPGFHAVARYEYFAAAELERAVNLYDIGFAWFPRTYVLVKADYLIADHGSEVAAPGFRASLSLLF